MGLLTIHLRPGRRDLRQFGFICLVAFGLLGFGFFRRSGFQLDAERWTTVVALALWGIGLLSAIFSLFRPAANRPLYVALVVITYPIGMIVSYLILVILFFGLITPVGLFFRLLGRDVLRRRFDPQATSYWVPHRPADSIARYFRQF